MQKPYLEAGKIVNTHGVRGEVRIQPWADDAAFLLGFRTFYIDGAPVHVAHSRVHKGMLVGKFADYDDVNAALTLKYRVVSIARADVTLPDGQYFQQDLIGIAVETEAGEPRGTLREKNTKCASGAYFELCNGGCRAVALALTGDKLGVDPSKCLVWERGYHKKLEALLPQYHTVYTGL